MECVCSVPPFTRFFIKWIKHIHFAIASPFWLPLSLYRSFFFSFFLFLCSSFFRFFFFFWRGRRPCLMAAPLIGFWDSSFRHWNDSISRFGCYPSVRHFCEMDAVVCHSSYTNSGCHSVEIVDGRAQPWRSSGISVRTFIVSFIRKRYRRHYTLTIRRLVFNSKPEDVESLRLAVCTDELCVDGCSPTYLNGKSW